MKQIKLLFSVDYFALMGGIEQLGSRWGRSPFYGQREIPFHRDFRLAGIL